MDLRLAAAEVNAKQNLLWKQPEKKKESRLKTAACRCQCRWEAICSCFLHCCSSQIGGTVPRNVYPYAYCDTVCAVWFCNPRPVLAFWYCRCLRLCVYACVSLCVNHLLVCAIIRDLFKLGSPNLEQMCKTTWLKFLLFCGAINLDLQVKFNLKVWIYPVLSLSSL